MRFNGVFCKVVCICKTVLHNLALLAWVDSSTLLCHFSNLIEFHNVEIVLWCICHLVHLLVILELDSIMQCCNDVQYWKLRPVKRVRLQKIAVLYSDDCDIFCVLLSVCML